MPKLPRAETWPVSPELSGETSCSECPESPGQQRREELVRTPPVVTPVGAEKGLGSGQRDVARAPSISTGETISAPGGLGGRLGGD